MGVVTAGGFGGAMFVVLTMTGPGGGSGTLPSSKPGPSCVPSKSVLSTPGNPVSAVISREMVQFPSLCTCAEATTLDTASVSEVLMPVAMSSRLKNSPSSMQKLASPKPKLSNTPAKIGSVASSTMSAETVHRVSGQSVLASATPRANAAAVVSATTLAEELKFTHDWPKEGSSQLAKKSLISTAVAFPIACSTRCNHRLRLLSLSL